MNSARLTDGNSNTLLKPANDKMTDFLNNHLAIMNALDPKLSANCTETQNTQTVVAKANKVEADASIVMHTVALNQASNTKIEEKNESPDTTQSSQPLTPTPATKYASSRNLSPFFSQDKALNNQIDPELIRKINAMKINLSQPS
jgi:hypothetical protein